MLNPVNLSIFYCNDFHGNSDDMSGVVMAAQNFNTNSDGDTFVLSAGDNYSGADEKKNEFIMSLMGGMMGVELSAIGNHELDGTSKGFYNSTHTGHVQFIATNVEYGNGNPMKDTVKKSVIKEKNGSRYGFVGAMPIDFDAVSKEANRKDIRVMSFEDSVKSIQSEVDKLKEQGIDKIIMLSHSGYDMDKQYAKELNGVDIIVGGHTHNVVRDAKIGENVVTSKSGEPVLILQAGENAKHFGIANVEFRNGLLTRIQNNLYDNTIKTKNLLIEYIKDQKLGKSPVVTYINKIDRTPENRRIVHCPWTSMLADSMRDQMGTEIAIVNAANIRKVPQPGKLTERDITESAPMKNDLLVTKVTEKQLVDAIRNASKKTMTHPEGKPGLLHVSGMSYMINTKGNLLQMNIGDRPIDINNPSDKEYTACYDIFVAKKDGEHPELYPQFPVKQYNFDKDTTMINYIRGTKSLDVVDDGRLQILKPLDVIA